MRNIFVLTVVSLFKIVLWSSVRGLLLGSTTGEVHGEVTGEDASGFMFSQFLTPLIPFLAHYNTYCTIFFHDLPNLRFFNHRNVDADILLIHFYWVFY